MNRYLILARVTSVVHLLWVVTLYIGAICSLITTVFPRPFPFNLVGCSIFFVLWTTLTFGGQIIWKGCPLIVLENYYRTTLAKQKE